MIPYLFIPGTRTPATSPAASSVIKNKNLTQEEKEAFVKSYDFDKMTEQDEKVWGMIFNHLD